MAHKIIDNRDCLAEGLLREEIYSNQFSLVSWNLCETDWDGEQHAEGPLGVFFRSTSVESKGRKDWAGDELKWGQGFIVETSANRMDNSQIGTTLQRCPRLGRCSSIWTLIWFIYWR